MDIVAPSVSSIQKQFPKMSSIEALTKEGFKAVYKINNEGTLEALKLIQLPALSPTKDEQETGRHEMLSRAKRETEALEKFNVPEIVKLGKLKPETVSLEGNDYLAYTEEFLTGKNLGDLISTASVPSEAELKILFLSLIKGIREIWRNDYIHRDIKPKNVMKTENPSRQFVLLDLGVAFSVHGESLTANPDARPGTLLYMAPEEFDTDYKDNIDYRCDLYSAALTVFEYASHVHPLKKNGGLARTISRILHQDPTPLKSIRQDLSDDFCGIVDQMLKKKPANRPGNIELLIKALEQ